MPFDRDACEFLDHICEQISENSDNGMVDPEGDGLELSDSDMSELRELEQRFIDELEKRIPVWGCTPVAVVLVPFRDWWESLTDIDRECLRG
jgi:hypothetical protein